MLLQIQNQRGAVGIRDGKTWQAVYNFENSTPTIFGPVVWEIAQKNWKRLAAWGEEFLRYTYWQEYLNKGLCPYCGKYDVGFPDVVRSNLLLKKENGKSVPDPESRHHSHKPKSGPISSKDSMLDGLWVEWSYIINPKDYMLEIIRSVRDKGTIRVKKKSRAWDQPKYRYHSIGLYSLFNDEPDWERMERVGLTASAYYWNKYNSQSKEKFFL